MMMRMQKEKKKAKDAEDKADSDRDSESDDDRQPTIASIAEVESKKTVEKVLYVFYACVYVFVGSIQCRV